MKSIEEFFSERNHQSSRGTALTSSRGKSLSALPPEVRRAAKLGLAIFPVSQLAKLTGQPDLLIGEATGDISRLEELAVEYAEYPACTWRAAVGPSGLCVVRRDGLRGRASLAALSSDQDDSFTLRARQGDTDWALFWRPKVLALRASARKLARGVSLLVDYGSFPIPPSDGCTWLNYFDIEAVPFWLRELAFETPDCPPGRVLSAPIPHTASCRSTTRFDRQPWRTQKGYSNCDQAGWRGGFRASRRR